MYYIFYSIENIIIWIIKFG